MCTLGATIPPGIRLENIDVSELLSWMSEPMQIDEEEYRSWKEVELGKRFQTPIRRLEFVRGNDFKVYEDCARILYWDTHDPILKISLINKGIFGARKRHDLIEGRLKELGWHPEHNLERTIEPYGIRGIGHMDAISPSELFFLEIKHNRPCRANELQGAWYQFLHVKHPAIFLLYPRQMMILPDLKKLMAIYIPRVVGTIVHDILPPLHPNFPRCRGTCDYAHRCGREKTIKMRETRPEWDRWFESIGARYPLTMDEVK